MRGVVDVTLVLLQLTLHMHVWVQCVQCVCLCAQDQTLTPRKRPCFPYLTTTEHVSPWPQAVLFMGFVCVFVCICVCVCAMFIVCLCSLFAWGVAQHQNCYYSVFSLRCFSLLLLCNSENLQHFISFFLSFFPLHLFPSTFLVFLSVILCGFEPALTSRATSNPEPHCLRFRFLRLN